MAVAINTAVSNSAAASPIAVTPTCSALDVLVKVLCFDAATATTLTPPASFDELISQACASSDGGRLALLRKKSASGAEGSLSTSNSGSLSSVAAIISISGADNTTPEDVASVAAVSTTMDAAPRLLSASITPVTNGCLILAAYLTDTSSGADSRTLTFSTTSGTTGAWTSSLVAINSGFYHLHVGWAIQTTAGAITVQGSSGGAGTAAAAIALMAIRPASAGGGIKRNNLMLFSVGR